MLVARTFTLCLVKVLFFSSLSCLGLRAYIKVLLLLATPNENDDDDDDIDDNNDDDDDETRLRL